MPSTRRPSANSAWHVFAAPLFPLYGRRSERQEKPRSGRPRGQRRGAPGHGRTRRPGLEERIEERNLPTAARACSGCGKPYVANGVDESGLVEIEVRAHRRVIRRRRWRRTCDCVSSPVEVSPPPAPRLFANTPYGTSVWSRFLFEHYACLRPLHRVAAWLSDQGLPVSPGTLADSVPRFVSLFEPLVEAIRAHQNAAPLRHADMTETIECRYYGRDFTTSEMALLRALIAGPPALNRHALSKEFCRRIGWTKPDGGLKDMMARVVMLAMHLDGRIELPPPKWRQNRPGPIVFGPDTEPPLLPPPATIDEVRPVELRTVVRGDRWGTLWNEFVARYHYLGYKTLVGAQMRYAVHAKDGTPLAMLGFSTAAWTLAPRDRCIGWTPELREKSVSLTRNNPGTLEESRCAVRLSGTSEACGKPIAQQDKSAWRAG